MENKSKTFVFDTNVLISALIFPSTVPAQALHRALAQGNLAISQACWDELEEVLDRPKFRKYLSSDDLEVALTRLQTMCLFVFPTHSLTGMCRDDNDTKFLEAAVEANAKFLVTGDNDLLVLRDFQSIMIVTPAQFLSLVET